MISKVSKYICFGIKNQNVIIVFGYKVEKCSAINKVQQTIESTRMVKHVGMRAQKPFIFRDKFAVIRRYVQC